VVDREKCERSLYERVLVGACGMVHVSMASRHESIEGQVSNQSNESIEGRTKIDAFRIVEPPDQSG
jgi:hypothetical protein